MDAIEFQIQTESEVAFMRYWGPTKRAADYWAVECGDESVLEDSQAWPTWWDMQAPPAFAFIPMLQILLLISGRTDGPPLHALVPVNLNGKDWDLRLTFPSAWTFRLAGLENLFQL